MQTTDTIQATAAPEEMLHPGNRTLFRYWEAIRGDISAPKRDWLDLRQIRSLIPFLYMIERKPEADYVWRLAGTQVCGLWGMEVTGKPALALRERFEHETVTRLLDAVVDGHQPFVMRFRMHSGSGASVAAEFTGLPLQARNGDTHVFGAAMPFREARRLHHDHVIGFELCTARTLCAEPIRQAVDTPLKTSRQPFQIINGGLS
jgi:hypothetical protein